MDARHMTSFKFLLQEFGTLSPQELTPSIEELTLLLRQLATEPEQFVMLFSRFEHGCNANHIRQALERAESTPMSVEWYGDYDDLNALAHYLKRLLVLFELALHRNWSIFHIRCEMFLENRQA
jgi:hypothetical protein